jgi:MFS family permease
MSDRLPRPTAARTPRRRLALGLLIVNQLLAGVGVASAISIAAILVADLTGVTALGGLSQSASVLGSAVAAVPLARLAVRSGRHVALATGYAFACAGALLVIGAATSGLIPLVFVGLAAFGAGAAAGLQARFAATEVASPGYEARSMSLVLWATTIGSVAGPLLSQSGDTLGRSLGLPPLVGPFLISAAVFAASLIIAATVLRLPKAGQLATDAEAVPVLDGAAVAEAAPVPEAAQGAAPAAPAASARPAPAPPPPAHAAEAAEAAHSAAARPTSSWHAFRTALRDPRSRFAILAIVCSHTVMVGVMVMTPVHMMAHGASLAAVGIVVSIHILGMYGASPLIGWLADRIGPVPVIGGGATLLLVAALIGIFAAPDDMLAIPFALGLLGFGWSGGLIGGSMLLTTTVDPAHRVALQGATDAAMNVAAAASAALSGVVLGTAGYAGVNVVAILVLVPLVIAGLTLPRGTMRVAT